MSPADELRAAATRLEELAASATPGPWTADHELITAPSGTGSAAPTLITEVVGSSFEGGGVAREADSAWIAAMSPALAAPLAAWLRSAADATDEYDALADPDSHISRMCADTDNVAGSYRHTAAFIQGARAVARVINGTTS